LRTPEVAEDEVTVLGRRARLEGDLVAHGSLRIDGDFKGKIAAEGDVTLSAPSQVEADIQAQNVTLAGNFKGTRVHTGEVQIIEGKAGGIAVHIGSRVCSLASPGEVLVSSTVKDLVAGSGLVFEDRGEHELKGVPDRWHLYRVVSKPA